MPHTGMDLSQQIIGILMISMEPIRTGFLEIQLLGKIKDKLLKMEMKDGISYNIIQITKRWNAR